MTIKLVLQTLAECLIQTKGDAVFYSVLFSVIVIGSALALALILKASRLSRKEN